MENINPIPSAVPPHIANPRAGAVPLGDLPEDRLPISGVGAAIESVLR